MKKHTDNEKQESASSDTSSYQQSITSNKGLDEVVRVNTNTLHQRIAAIKKDQKAKKQKPRGYQGL